MTQYKPWQRGCAVGAAQILHDNRDLLMRARVVPPTHPRALRIELDRGGSSLHDLASWFERHGGVLRAETDADDDQRIAELVFHHCCLRVEVVARVPLILEGS